MFNDEMIAHSIEGVFVQSGRVGLFKAFVEFEIEDLKPQGLRGADFIQVAGEPSAVVGRRAYQQPDGFKGCIHEVQLSKFICQHDDV